LRQAKRYEIYGLQRACQFVRIRQYQAKVVQVCEEGAQARCSGRQLVLDKLNLQPAVAIAVANAKLQVGNGETGADDEGDLDIMVFIDAEFKNSPARVVDGKASSLLDEVGSGCGLAQEVRARSDQESPCVQEHVEVANETARGESGAAELVKTTLERFAQGRLA
jgi:hypothetical protein